MSTYYVQDFYKSDHQQIAHLKSKPGTNFKWDTIPLCGHISQSVSESFSQSVSQWASELVSQWVSELVSQWVSVSVRQWVSESVDRGKMYKLLFHFKL